MQASAEAGFAHAQRGGPRRRGCRAGRRRAAKAAWRAHEEDEGGLAAARAARRARVDPLLRVLGAAIDASLEGDLEALGRAAEGEPGAWAAAVKEARSPAAGADVALALRHLAAVALRPQGREAAAALARFAWTRAALAKGVALLVGDAAGGGGGGEWAARFARGALAEAGLLGLVGLGLGRARAGERRARAGVDAL